MIRTLRNFALSCLSCALFSTLATAAPVLINFDDVAGSNVDITNRYAGLTLNAIDNPFPLAGTFPASSSVPTALGGVQTWIDGFPSAPSPTQIAVAQPTATTGNAGDGGILMTFDFDISFLSLIGVDNGFTQGNDDESVTLTAWDAAGNLLGQTFSNTNLPAGTFDQTSASIAFSGMRFVAFNYTDTQFGFYGIDDLKYESTAIPEPSTMILLGMGLVGTAILRKRRQS